MNQDKSKSDQSKIDDKRVYKKSLKFQRPSILKFIGNKNISDTSEIHFLNRKRVIQMLDLFNSKYDCKKCRKKLRYKADKIIHEKLKHSLSSNLIKCPECDLEFKTYLTLTSHLMTVHLNERPYGCKICHKKFHAFSLLKRHCNKKHLNTESLPSSLLSPVSLNSYLSINTNSMDYRENTDGMRNNLYDLIDYENSILIKNENKQSSSLSSRSSVSSSSSASTTNSAYLQLSINNPLSINSEINMKYYNYLKRVPKSKPMDLEPIIQYINEENLLEKQFNFKKNQIVTFTICAKLSPINCNLCFKKFATNSELLCHAWQDHMNKKNLNLDILSKKSLSHTSYSHMNSNNIYHIKSNMGKLKTCWTCATSNSKENFKTISFDSEEKLTVHCQEHLNETNLFKCTICPKFGFNSLEAAKAHYLNFHLEKSKNREDAHFEFLCASCENIYSDYNAILEHFETNLCNLYSSNISRVKCRLCHLEFNNSLAMDLHQSQHKYLNKGMETTDFDQFKTNNIKDSNNNKQYSIEALVNSPIKMAKKTKVEDIATKISLKQNTHHPITVSYPAALLMNLANQQELVTKKNDEINFVQNLNSIINDYNKSKNSSSITNNLLPNFTKKPQHSKLSTFFSHSLNSKISNVFGDMTTNITAVNSLLHNYNNQIRHLNNLSLSLFTGPHSDLDNLNTVQTTHSRFNNLQYFTNQSKNYNQRLTIPNFKNETPSPTNPLNRYIPEHQYSGRSSSSSSLLGFKCEYCGYSFKTVLELVEHSSQHVSLNQKRPLKCHLCSIKFAKVEQLIKHMIVHKDNGTDPICHICHATFGRKQDLDRHMIFHSK